jgi:hypothetical protein
MELIPFFNIGMYEVLSKADSRNLIHGDTLQHNRNSRFQFVLCSLAYLIILFQLYMFNSV